MGAEYENFKKERVVVSEIKLEKGGETADRRSYRSQCLTGRERKATRTSNEDGTGEVCGTVCRCPKLP